MTAPRMTFDFPEENDARLKPREDGGPRNGEARRPYPEGVHKKPYAISTEFASAPSGVLDVTGFAVYTGLERELYGLPIRLGVSDIETMRTSILPAGKHERLKMADAYYESDDYLGGVLDLKRDFSCLGFTLAYSISKVEEVKLLALDDAALEKALEAEMETQAEIEEYLRLVQQEWNFGSVVSDLFLKLYITDSFILYWKDGDRSGRETLPGVLQILSLNPKDCEWKNDQGQDQLFYTIPQEIRDKIKDAYKGEFGQPKNDAAIKAKLLEQGIPEDWVDSVQRGEYCVELTEENGDHWIIHTNGPEQAGLSNPSMYRIFLYLEMRRALRDGDFATSYMMKHFIQHVTMGESAGTSGMNANTRVTWAQENEIEAMHEIMRQGVRAGRLVTNHTVKVGYVYPPKDMFDNAKYSKPEAMILHWSHMLEVMLNGGGTTNSSGFLGVKSLAAHIEFSRQRVNDAIMRFFRILRKGKTVKEIPDKYAITSSFDQNALKEPKQVLDELKWFVDINSMSPESALRETGRDANRVLLEKRRAAMAQKKSGLYDQIIFRSSQTSNALSSGNSDSLKSQGGRPPNASTTPNEDTRTQPPTASS